MLLFGDFGCRRRKFQLYLAVKGGKFGLQLFQFFLLLPHLACYLLQLRYLTFQDLILRFILVDDGGDSLNRVEEPEEEELEPWERLQVGDTVIHKSFGEGEIMAMDDKYVIIKFADREAKFLYPAAFEKGYFQIV